MSPRTCSHTSIRKTVAELCVVVGRRAYIPENGAEWEKKSERVCSKMCINQMYTPSPHILQIYLFLLNIWGMYLWGRFGRRERMNNEWQKIFSGKEHILHECTEIIWDDFRNWVYYNFRIWGRKKEQRGKEGRWEKKEERKFCNNT